MDRLLKVQQIMSGLGKYVRGFALAMMFFLSVAANCTSDSYDPDPYDDTPPVTVEFEYVTPHVTTAPSNRQDLVKSFAAQAQVVYPPSPQSLQAPSGFLADSNLQSSAPISAPLRR